MEYLSQQTNTSSIKRVMVSSTARDLPEHRKEVLDACLRQGMFPIMMEYLPASDADAIEESLRIVNEADIYLGIFAYRYGYIPKGHDISITEMEYNRAVARGIPRLIFLMHEDHPIKVTDVERDERAIQLENLKARLKTERVVNFFKSPTELRAHVINSLSFYRQPKLTTFHHYSEIPIPPDPYIAHPYTLLQTQLIGRQTELDLLTNWVSLPSSDVYRTRILNIVAIGGMGKSAFTWKWFNDIAPYKMQPLAGRLWWSFYESNSSFEDFVPRTLAYVTEQPITNILEIPQTEREVQLLGILDQEPFLIVLDGLERLLLAYATFDAARLLDDDLDQRTANVVAGALGLPESAAFSFTGQHRLRKTADPRTGAFLRKLASVRSARILVTTRLYPADLQTDTGFERLGCRGVFLRGLAEDEALNLWRAYGVSGTKKVLLPLFNTFDNHPLLIQVLAGEIAHDRHAPGNFDLWRKTHPDFNPFNLPLVQVKSHVLKFAFRELDESTRKTLYTIAAFRMPATYDTLAALLVGKNRIFLNENALIVALTNLEDRGLLGWDRNSNRYDLHPIVRGVTWSGLGKQVRKGIYKTLNTHFLSVMEFDNRELVSNLEDLTAIIELYNTLIGLERYDDAAELFTQRLNFPLNNNLAAFRQSVELLEMLFLDGLDQLPNLSDPVMQASILGHFAYSLRDLPEQAAAMLYRSIALNKAENNMFNVIDNLSDLAEVLFFSGNLYRAEIAGYRALLIARQEMNPYYEVECLCYLGIILAIRGERQKSANALNRSLSLAGLHSHYEAYDYLAMCALWSEQYTKAQELSDKALKYWRSFHFERGIIRAIRLQGMAAPGLGDLSLADECLHHALTRARIVNLVEEELQALVGIAKLQQHKGEYKAAREVLDDFWESAERGHFQFFQADAYNIMAQIEHKVGNASEAISAAKTAYSKAWCDGPPFSYHWGLHIAKTQLAVLNISEPVLPAFDASKNESMPVVEIEPIDSLKEE